MMTIISHLGHVPAHQGIAVGAEVMGIPDEKKNNYFRHFEEISVLNEPAGQSECRVGSGSRQNMAPAPDTKIVILTPGKKIQKS